MTRIKAFQFILISAITCNCVFAQSIKGEFKLLANQEITLEGFEGMNTYPISKCTTDQNGSFKLTYADKDFGMGFLKSAGNKPLFVILSGEDIVLQGQALSQPQSIQILKGKQNQWFGEYAMEQPIREQALNAWIYLEKMYQQDSLFSSQQEPLHAILHEKKRLYLEDSIYIASLPVDSYVRWFLPNRKLVSSVSTIAKYRPEEISETIKAFRQMDYTDHRMYKSGLFKDAIESHFWLIENSGSDLETVFKEMKISIDRMMEKLVTDEEKLNVVTDYLFDLLERHSLFEASEYLAVKVLNEVSCTIDSDLANQLETYRAMKKGNTAKDFIFPETVLTNANKETPKKLSDVQDKYTLVVFGASWCPKCKEELPEIAKHYEEWKKNGVEVVFVSLDENMSDFQSFSKGFPFISTCDFKKWDGQIAKDYYVFATPTMYLLDKDREIKLRPKSVQQVDSWIDWYLVKSNESTNNKD